MAEQSKLKRFDPRQRAIERVATTMVKVGIGCDEVKSWAPEQWKGIGRLVEERGIKGEVMAELRYLYTEEAAGKWQLQRK